MDNGHIMTIERKLPFHMQEMNLLEINMLQANHVPSILPLSWNEVDQALTFSYSIQSYRQLTHYYQLRSISMLDYYSLLLSLIDGLAICYDYMLRPECCLLDEKLIYIDPQTSKLALAYIPIHETTEGFQQQLLLLVVRWSALVKHLEPIPYQQILNEVSSATMTLNPIRQLLLSLIHQISGNEQRDYRIEHMQPFPKEIQTVEKEVEVISEQLENDPHTDPANHDSNNDPLSSFSFSRIADSEDIEDLEEENTSRPVTLKHGLVVVLVTICIFLTWKEQYANESNMTNFLLCCGITMILLTVIVFTFKNYWQLVWFQKKSEPQDDFDLITASSSSSFPSFAKQEASHEPSKSNLNSLSNSFDNSANPIFPSISAISHARKEASSQATVMLDRTQSTTFLGASEHSASFALRRTLYKEEQHISLIDTQFLIGRADEGVHYQDDAKGVSRVHLEVDIHKGEIFVKDVGSRNGSYLNGQLMIAYKSYRLQVGDIVQLVNTDGPLYQLVS